jgi:hypothetical protein
MPSALILYLSGYSVNTFLSPSVPHGIPKSIPLLLPHFLISSVCSQSQKASVHSHTWLCLLFSPNPLFFLFTFTNIPPFPHIFCLSGLPIHKHILCSCSYKHHDTITISN